MGKKDWEVIVGAAIGVIGAIALAKALSEKRCKYCKTSNPNSNTLCKQCGRML